MDIVRFKGGLGNQMFQYAFAEGLRAYGRCVGCSLGFYRKYPEMMPFCLQEVFPDIDLNEVDDETFNQIDNQWIEIKNDQQRLSDFLSDYENRFFYVESKSRSEFDENVFKTKNCVFVGYWQTEKYFKQAAAKIKTLYVFHPVESRITELGDMLGEYFGVHIRRQDYLKNPYYDNICTEAYYHKAIHFLMEQNESVKLAFFSDDIEWVKQAFRVKNAWYCEKNTFEHYKDWYDMYLMSKCRGNIIANSSFSWWGAWLNETPGKIVIAPKRWLNTCKTPDIWCDDWIKM